MFWPFGQWRPDLAALGNTGSPLISNVIPDGAEGYSPFPSAVAFSSNALADRCRGAVAARKGGSRFVYAGDATALYRLDNSAWTNVSGAVYTTAAASSWEFTQINGKLIATNYDDAVQAATVGSGLFADLFTSTRTPRARHVAVARESFLFMGDVVDADDGAKPSRVWWSADGDESDADPSVTTGANYQDLDEADGAVQRVIGGEYVTVICEQAIYRMTYVGGAVIWRKDKIARNRGAICPGSVVDFDRMTFFIDRDGFYLFDGTSAKAIGEDKVNRHFWADVDASRTDRISASIFPGEGIVVWAYPSAGSGGNATKLIGYCWKIDRWFPVTLPDPVLLVFPAYTAVAASIDTDPFAALPIDTEPQASWNIDDPAFAGGQLGLGALDADNQLVFFNGPGLAATLETPDIRPFPTQRARINALTPVVEGSGTVTAALGHKDLSTAELSWTNAVPLNSIGTANIIREGRYIRFRANIAAGWDGKALGIEAEPIAAGMR